MNIAIIFAGGIGSRMGNIKVPKQFLEVGDKPIIIHTLEKFQNCDQIDYIAVSCLEEYIPYLKTLLSEFGIDKVRWVVKGGKTGQLSIYNGIKAVYDDPGIDKSSLLLIHDGVRPNIDEDLIVNNIKTAWENGNSVTVSPAQETIFLSHDHKNIETILNRSNAYHAKAPQCFFLCDLFLAHKEAIRKNDVNNWDSCSLMFKNGISLNFVEGKNSNLKITTIEDFYLYKTLYEMQKNDFVKEKKLVKKDI